MITFVSCVRFCLQRPSSVFVAHIPVGETGTVKCCMEYFLQGQIWLPPSVRRTCVAKSRRGYCTVPLLLLNLYGYFQSGALHPLACITCDQFGPTEVLLRLSPSLVVFWLRNMKDDKFCAESRAWSSARYIRYQYSETCFVLSSAVLNWNGEMHS
jgi:hypothetical protein